MKNICATIAIFFSLMIAFGSIAELMGAPTDPPPLMFTVDKVLAALCLICSIAAFWKPMPAAIAIWCVTIVHAVLSWKLDPPGQLIRGVFRFTVAAAVFLFIGAITEKRRSFAN